MHQKAAGEWHTRTEVADPWSTVKIPFKPAAVHSRYTSSMQIETFT